MSQPSVAVLVPLYRPQPNALDDIGLRRLDEVLGGYKRFRVVPEGLDTAPYERFGEAEDMRFPADCFRDPQAYGRLLLDEAFYARFAAFEYVLIHQSDVFVFHDGLPEFCAMGLDYFGAPWPDGFSWPRFSPKGIPKLMNRYPGLRPRRKVYVGNGGFSLRNVEAVRTLLTGDWISSRTYRGQEDVYFATRIFTRWKERFKICDVDTAWRFAFERSPREGYERLGGQLPFGCHAWEKYDPEFFRPHLAALGYEF